MKGGYLVRLASIQTLREGARLARPLYDEKGVVLVNAGVELTSYLINRLQRMGITTLYIEDGRTDDIVVADVISDQTRQEALHTVHQSLATLTTHESFPRAFQQAAIGRKIRDLFDQILGEMRSNRNLLLNVNNIYAQDGMLYHHSVNVSVMTLAIGIAHGLTDKQLLDLGVGTMLHDVGKLQLPTEVLNKPGRLTDDEFTMIKKHTTYGYDILRLQDDISAVSAHIALQHHERVDGTGYPRGLTGAQMHPYAKMTAVADVFEALTANRVYRRGHLPHEALELLLGSCGTQFDTEMVNLFLQTVAIYPMGMTVTLNSGEEGVISAVHRSHPQRPTVRVLKHPNGEEVASPYEIDLMTELTTMITHCGMEASASIPIPGGHS